MLGLITDRTQENVERLEALKKIGWDRMTAAEKAEWSGDPITAEAMGYTAPYNLLPLSPYYSDNVELTYRNTYIMATATTPGSYLYAVAIIGAAANFAGKTMTLSMDSALTTGSATPQVSLYWHDGNGFEYAGGSLSEGGSVTFTATDNSENREYLAMYIYAATDTAVSTGDLVRYNGLMLEFGDVRHDYVPYTPILPTPAAKGAYNYSDLNRVEIATAEMAESLGLNLITKTNWNPWDIPRESDMQRYLNNIYAIRNACPDKDSFPVLPSRMDGLNLVSANAIEETLIAVNISSAGMYRCGDIFTGEV